eukprot:3688768-Amphidinium_carterae.1
MERGGMWSHHSLSQCCRANAPAAITKVVYDSMSWKRQAVHDISLSEDELLPHVTTWAIGTLLTTPWTDNCQYFKRWESSSACTKEGMIKTSYNFSNQLLCKVHGLHACTLYA